MHREYSFRASTFISIYKDRIEFTSIGGLVSGITLKDVMMGISVCRNVKLANIFYHLELIEAYGTGMRKIMEAYSGTGKEPKIETSDNTFKVILPNLNVYEDEKKSTNRKKEEKEAPQVMKEEDYLFDKTYECPVCYQKMDKNQILFCHSYAAHKV